MFIPITPTQSKRINNQHRCADAEIEDEITVRAIFLIRRFGRRFRYRCLRGSRG